MSERIIEYREALNEALLEEMDHDPNVFIMGEDVGRYGGVLKISRGVHEKFGEKRAIDTPIAEEGFTVNWCRSSFGGITASC